MNARRALTFVAVAVAATAAAGGLVVALQSRPDSAGATGGSSRPAASASPDHPTGSPTPSGVEPACAPGLPPRELTVATFNIHFAERHGRVELESLAAEIDALDADLVLLQEVDRARPRSKRLDEPRELRTLLAEGVVYGVADRRGRTGRVGNAVVTDLPVLATRRYRLPGRPGFEDRSLLRVTVSVSGRPVDVFVTHLDHHSPQVRLPQGRTIARIVARSTHPVILGADLNATPDSPVHGRLTRWLSDAWLEAGSGGGETVPAGHPRRRIDVVLHDDSFAALSAETVQSAVSDHRAVRVRLRGVPHPPCG